jgi:hypothetical protein
MPFASITAQRPERVDSARAVVVPTEPRKITLGWDKGEPTAETEVWQTTDLRTWQLFAAVPGDRLTVALTNPQAFYKIRNRVSDGAGGYVYSVWCGESQN